MFRPSARGFLGWVLLVATIAIWFFAGYRIGLTRGKGWRGAVIEGRCEIRCPREDRPSRVSEVFLTYGTHSCIHR